MVLKAIAKMQSGKAAGPSGIVAEMFKAAGIPCAVLIRDLAVSIVSEGKIPADWEESFIICLFKGKGDALLRGNYPAGQENTGEPRNQVPSHFSNLAATFWAKFTRFLSLAVDFDRSRTLFGAGSQF